MPGRAFGLVHYSLQGNHAHLIVEARDRDTLGRGTLLAVGWRRHGLIDPADVPGT